MAAQFKMAAKTRVSSESLILMLKLKIFSGLFTLTKYLTFMEENSKWHPNSIWRISFSRGKTT
jgi:hypothetical protein